MVCCGYVLIVTVFAIIVTIIYMSKKKTEKKLAQWKQKLREKYENFGNSEIREFEPSTKLTEEEFTELKDRLKKRRINDNLDDPDNSPYGTPVGYINNVAEYMINEFDFSSVTKVLGQFKHYKTVIGDLDLHFIHMVGNEQKIPIILLHGFPSTIWEFHKSITLLHEQGHSVIVPSLPGHGFTDAPRIPGVSPAVIACSYNKLMTKLGYQKYLVHGGDWGAIIGKFLTFLFPENVLGLHLTMNVANFISFRGIVETLVGCVFPSFVYSTKQEASQFQPISTIKSRNYRQFAYFHIQSCIPDTFGFGMVDSPVSLIGWHGATYPICSTSKRGSFMGSSQAKAIDGFEEGIKNFGMDNICSQISIFWCMKNAQAAMRIYYEFWWNDKDAYSAIHIPDVPVAISDFPNEIMHFTKFVSKGTFPNLKQFNHHEKGGHFSHIDATELVVNDITSFIAKL